MPLAPRRPRLAPPPRCSSVLPHPQSPNPALRCPAGSPLPGTEQTPRAAPRPFPVRPQPPARAGCSRRQRCPPRPRCRAPTRPLAPAPCSPRPSAGAAPAATSACPYSGAGQGGGSIPRRPPSCRGGTCSLTGTGGEGRRGVGERETPGQGPVPALSAASGTRTRSHGPRRRGGRRRPRGPARARPAPRLGKARPGHRVWGGGRSRYLCEASPRFFAAGLPPRASSHAGQRCAGMLRVPLPSVCRHWPG